MLIPEFHTQEVDRLQALAAYGQIDTPPDADLNDLTNLASDICNTPMALITLVNGYRQWFKAKKGIDIVETPREIALCAHSILSNEDILEIPDARLDERFKENPFVKGEPHVVFYAGAILRTETGLPLGTLCVLDTQPRKLNMEQLNALKTIADQVMYRFELQKNQNQLLALSNELQNKNDELARFAYVAAHDLKTPLNTIGALVDLFKKNHSTPVDAEGHKILSFIKDSSDRLYKLVENLLNFSRLDNLDTYSKTNISLKSLVHYLTKISGSTVPVKFSLNSTLEEVVLNDTLLDQILMNLVNNAIKHNDKDTVEIELAVAETDTHYMFTLKDNGPGIATDNLPKIFTLFETISNKDRFGIKGNGIGLATVKTLVEKNQGRVSVESKFGEGCSFQFSLIK
ncbi:MAG: GAF domain-containing sensor histidine kinase [bacterium]|nr:GAF domain-containing sensor histidine kinase [bacterium]